MTQIDTPSGGWSHSSGILMRNTLAPNAEISLGIETLNSGYIAYECSTLKKLSLPNLKTSSGTIAYGCSNLTVLELPELEIAYTKNFTLLTNTNITSDEWHLPKAKFLGSYQEGRHLISYCNNIKKLVFDKCETIGGGTWRGPLISSMENLEEISIPVCKYVGFDINYNSETNEYYTGNQTNYSYLYDSTCKNIKTLYMPNCEKIGYGYWNTMNAQYVILGNLTYLTSFAPYGEYNMYFLCSHLEICANGGRFNSSLKFNHWIPEMALSEENKYEKTVVEINEDKFDNLMQFLYNFKIFFFDRFLDRTNAYTSKQTITISSMIYDNVFGYLSDHVSIDESSYSRTKTLSEIECLTDDDISLYGYDEHTTYYEWITTICGKKLWTIAYA